VRLWYDPWAPEAGKTEWVEVATSTRRVRHMQTTTKTRRGDIEIFSRAEDPGIRGSETRNWEPCAMSGMELEVETEMDAQWQPWFASARVILIASAPSLTNVGKTNFYTCFLGVFPLFLLLLLFCCFIFHSAAKYATVCARRRGGDSLPMGPPAICPEIFRDISHKTSTQIYIYIYKFIWACSIQPSIHPTTSPRVAPLPELWRWRPGRVGFLYERHSPRPPSNGKPNFLG